MHNDPEAVYRHLVIDCPTVRDVWVELTCVPPEQLEELLVCALRHAIDALESRWMEDAQRRTALAVANLICDRVLYVKLGVPRSPDAHI